MYLSIAFSILFSSPLFDCHPVHAFRPSHSPKTRASVAQMARRRRICCLAATIRPSLARLPSLGRRFSIVNRARVVEQMCINVANEQLQFFFNESIYAWELRE